MGSTLRFVFCAATCALLFACSDADPDREAKKAKTDFKARLTLAPVEPLQEHKPAAMITKLLDLKTFRAITNDQLQTLYTQKIHLFLIDPTFTDFHHLHPQPTETPGIYSVRFTPRLGTTYRAWAEISPSVAGTSIFASDDLGYPRGGMMRSTSSLNAAMGRHNFSLSFDTKLKVDETTAANIHITDKSGAAVSMLEPHMGASAHIIAFYDDFRTVEHLTAYSTTSGVRFDFTPTKDGFVKLFLQVKIAGKMVTVPFGIVVPPDEES
ncbi:MAG: hypothetical protein ACN2B6_06805 [Rickettsiales bacterium]